MGISGKIVAHVKKLGLDEVDQNNKAIEQSIKTSTEVKTDGVIFRPMDGILRQNVVITVTGTDLVHNLKRKPIGFLVIDLNANSTIYNITPNDNEYDFKNKIKLRATTEATVSLWIF